MPFLVVHHGDHPQPVGATMIDMVLIMLELVVIIPDIARRDLLIGGVMPIFKHHLLSQNLQNLSY